MDSIKLVEEFHLLFNHSIAAIPCIPSDTVNCFRDRFIKEELLEAIEAIERGDIVGLADALGDIQYVLDGWFLNAGLHNKKEAIMAEIHRSNLSKLCLSEEIAQATIESLVTADGENPQAYQYAPVKDKWVVYRSSDGKVMKSIHYFPPNLKSVVDTN